MSKPKTLKEALRGILTDDEMEVLRRAYDIVGDIAIIEIPDELLGKEKQIAETVLNLHKNVNVVAKKAGIHEGEFRTQQLEILAGEDRKETEYKENGVTLKLNPETCYFSPRLSTERKRIYQLINPGETVLVMFSGVAPYPVVISKNTQAQEIVGVEKNPHAHEYALENIRKNKAKNVTVHKGDVREIVPELGRYDHVLMPLPKEAEDFLDIAIPAVKPGGMLHFYNFLHEDQFREAEDKVIAACKELGRKCEIIRTVPCGQHAPRVYRICVDAMID